MRFLFLITFCLYSLNASDIQVETLETNNKYHGFDKCGSLTLDIKCK